jgi:hypothetical protein
MPLVTSSLQSQLKAAFLKAMSSKTSDAQEELCKDISTAIDTYLKSGMVATAGTTSVNGPASMAAPGSPPVPGPLVAVPETGTASGTMS